MKEYVIYETEQDSLCYMGEMFDIDTAIKVCIALNKSTN